MPETIVFGAVHGNEPCGMVAGDALKQENTSADKPEIIRLYCVIDRLHPDDRFSRNWQSFEKIRQGELIAYRHDGVELSAEKDG